MADTKISALVSLTGAGTDTANDVLAIVDTSAATTKKIIPDELVIASGASQAQMEAATTSTAIVRPSMQHFHPGMPKAWGFFVNTTVNASYPGSGVSVTHPSTGTFVVTHGRTFSSVNYAVMLGIFDVAQTISAKLTAQNTTTFAIVTYGPDGVVIDPGSGLYYSCFGDL